MDNLYLVAALPDLDVSRRVWDCKDDIAKKYGSTKGLKVLPHITEINPFKRSEHQETELIDQLDKLISSFTPLELNLKGFGFFTNPKSRTIYVAVENDPILQEQHKQLSLFARYKLGFDAKYAPLHFTPHMTVAYRDLDEQKFAYAWPEYSNRKFEEKMLLESLWLLKHDGLCWIPYEEFKFKGFGNALF
jgi:2'-5' RNA ligase